MIEREKMGNHVIIRYRCDNCKEGYLINNEFQKDEIGRYINTCSKCGRTSYKQNAYPYVEVK